MVFKRDTMPDSTVYEVEISTQQRGQTDTRQRHERSGGRGNGMKVGFYAMCVGEKMKRRAINSRNRLPSPIR